MRGITARPALLGSQGVFVLHIIAGLQTGGAEQMLLKLVSSPRRGLRHVVVSLTDEGPLGPAFRSAGIRVVALGMPRGRVTLRGLVGLARIVRREKPDLVQTWMYHADLIGGVVSRLMGARVYWNIRHSDLSARDNSRTVRAVAWLCARVSSWVPERILCCSLSGARVHQRAGYAPERFLVIGNGVDLTRFHPNPLARTAVLRDLNLAADSLLVLCVARFDPQKNHIGLLMAWQTVRRRCPTARLVLAGSGLSLDNAAVCSLLTQVGGQDTVVLLGPRDDIPNLMAASDLLVLPSIHGEGFPNVLIEAMASGLPCITTDVGDSAAIVGDCGVVVAPGSNDRLAEALVEMLQHPDAMRRTVGARARERAIAEFELERVVTLYESAYRTGALPSIFEPPAKRFSDG